MAKLETQINQIYFLGPETKKISIILYDEKLSSSTQLFLLAELDNMQRKTQATDLKKISEIILDTFRNNKRLAGDALFETSLSQINEQLGDLAHKGRKSWLGKFSCGITLKCSGQIYLANTGQISSWLRRNTELLEILAAEEIVLQPLKIFQNFTQGKIKEGDDLILTTSSVFNYVSFELFKNILKDTNLEQSCLQISKILQDSAGQDEGFAAFMLRFGADLSNASDFQTQEEIYAPLPEDIVTTDAGTKNVLGASFFSQLLKIPAKILALISNIFSRIRIPRFRPFQSLSVSGKFFLASFILFVALFSLNLIVTGIKSNNTKRQDTINEQINTLVNSVNETESSLLYNNQDQAFEFLKTTQSNLVRLYELDTQTAETYQPLIDDLHNKVNRISTIENPELFLNLEQAVDMFTKAGPGFVFTNSTTKTIQIYSTELNNLFMLNSTNGDIKGITHVDNLGNYVVSENQLYRINETLNQFDLVKDFGNANLSGLAFLAPNRAYTIDKSQNQIIRILFSANGTATPQTFLTTVVDLSQAQDVGVDTDIYALFPDKLSRYSRGIEQSFELATLTDPLAQANKLFIGSNIYILESSKKRLIIYNKQGNLVNQIYFPSVTELKGMYVDELERNIYVLDGKKLLKITF
ncbi:MAG: hypothetical protein Q8P83_03445 [bacterium]|nr:hypothetical protein [bacterium]